MYFKNSNILLHFTIDHFFMKKESNRVSE